MSFGHIIFESHHEKTNILHMQKQRGRSASKIQVISKISSFKSSPVGAQANLCQTWSENPGDWFSHVVAHTKGDMAERLFCFTFPILFLT